MINHLVFANRIGVLAPSLHLLPMWVRAAHCWEISESAFWLGVAAQVRGFKSFFMSVLLSLYKWLRKVTRKVEYPPLEILGSGYKSPSTTASLSTCTSSFSLPQAALLGALLKTSKSSTLQTHAKQLMRKPFLQQWHQKKIKTKKFVRPVWREDTHLCFTWRRWEESR